MTAQDTLSEREAPRQMATKEDHIILLLEELIRGREAERGRVETLMANEFALAAAGTAGDTRQVAADFHPDRWVVWARADANVTLRVAPGPNVTELAPAFEISNGRVLVFSHRSEMIAVRNIGTGAAHVFAVAVGGGAEFDIKAI